MTDSNKIERIQRNVNLPQKILVAIIAPLIGLVVAYGLIDLIANEILPYRVYNGYSSSPLDLQATWWMWAIALALLGVFEFFWLKTPSAGKKRCQDELQR